MLPVKKGNCHRRAVPAHGQYRHLWSVVKAGNGPCGSGGQQGQRHRNRGNPHARARRLRRRRRPVGKSGQRVPEAYLPRQDCGHYRRRGFQEFAGNCAHLPGIARSHDFFGLNKREGHRSWRLCFSRMFYRPFSGHGDGKVRRVYAQGQKGRDPVRQRERLQQGPGRGLCKEVRGVRRRYCRARSVYRRGQYGRFQGTAHQYQGRFSRFPLLPQLLHG